MEFLLVFKAKYTKGVLKMRKYLKKFLKTNFPCQITLDFLWPGFYLSPRTEREVQKKNRFLDLDFFPDITHKGLRGKVCKNGGTRPVWAEAFVFSLKSGEDCFLEIKDKDMITSDSTLGVCRIDVKELQEKGSINKWYKLYYKRKEVGEVELEATYTDQEYTSRVIVYPHPKRAKQPDEQPQVPQVDKTIKVREHFPRPEELAPKGENGWKCFMKL